MAEGMRPLDGVVVLDFTRVYSGPYCTMMLADLGAEVIKIEKKGTGEDSRTFPPFAGPDSESGYYLYLNRNKKSVELDLKDEASVAILRRMCEKADVVVENFAPGVMDRLGLGYDDMQKANPRIVYGSISGFGQTGPYRNKLAYDLITQGMGGYMAITGYPEGPPTKLGTAIADANAGIHMAFAITSALYCREKTGIGQYIDVAMMDTVFSTLEQSVVFYTYGGQVPHRIGNRNMSGVPLNAFKTSDGYVTIACANDALFKKLCAVMERPDLSENPSYATIRQRKEHEVPIEREIEAWTMARTTAEVVALLEEAKVPAGPIMEIDEVCNDPQIAARDMIVAVEHPREGTFRSPGNPLKFSKTKVDRFEHAPLLGQHTLDVLRRFGFSQAEIDGLLAAGVIEDRGAAPR